MNIRNFITRALAGGIYVGLIIGSLLFGSTSFGLLCMMIMMFSMGEYFKLVKKLRFRPADTLTTTLAVFSFALILVIRILGVDPKYLFLLPLVLLIVMVNEMFRNTKTPFSNIAFSCFGFLYIMLPIATLYSIGFYDRHSWVDHFNFDLVLGFFLLIWANDTGAYLLGSVIGKHKLFHSISPKKTVEGAIGGVMLTFVVAYFISRFSDRIFILDWMIISVLVVISGTFGDLFESMLKRKADVKDSGKLIPGHGGMLDRFDSVLFAAPAVFVYLALTGS